MHSHARAHAPHTRGRTIHWAHLYDILTGFLWLGKERAMREMTLDLAAVQPGETVLDVGCGTGGLTIPAKARAGATGVVHGVDPAPEMIERARQKAARQGLDVCFQAGVIEALPFPADHFDVVLSSLMLHHLPDDLKRAGFQDIYRVLKPGGRFLAVDLQPPALPVIKHLATLFFGHDMMRSNLHVLPPVMQDAGFVAVEVGPTRSRVLSFLRGTAQKAAAGPLPR